MAGDFGCLPGGAGVSSAPVLTGEAQCFTAPPPLAARAPARDRARDDEAADGAGPTNPPATLRNGRKQSSGESSAPPPLLLLEDHQDAFLGIELGRQAPAVVLPPEG